MNCKVFLISLMYIIMGTTVYTIFYESTRGIAGDLLSVPFMASMAFQVSFLFDYAPWGSKGLSSDISDNTSKRNFSLSSKPNNEGQFASINITSLLFLPIIVLIMAYPLTILGHHIINRGLFIDLAMVQIDSAVMAAVELQFVSNVVSVGFFCILIFRWIQISDDIIPGKIVLDYRYKLAFAGSGILAFLFPVIHSFFFVPITTIKSFWGFILFSIIFAFIFDVAASYAFRKTYI